jgi:hypothetical protein
MDDRGMLSALREDSAVFDILKLYDEDGVVPAAVFSNSPSRPDFETPLSQTTLKSNPLPCVPCQDSSLTAVSKTTRNGTENTSLASMSPYERNTSVAPLNVPSSSDPFKYVIFLYQVFC